MRTPSLSSPRLSQESARGAVQSAGPQARQVQEVADAEAIVAELPAEVLTNSPPRPAQALARGVISDTPEIIGSFELKPIFDAGLESLTPEGILIDSQINARKIRIDNVRDLFSRLQEDPESPVGLMVENLIGILEEELAKAETNVDTVQSITDSIFSFLGVFELKANSEVLARRIEQISQERAAANPDLPDYLTESKSYIEMMKDNHGFNQAAIDKFTNTKMLYYLASDIAAILRGPVRDTAIMFENRKELNGTPQDRSYNTPLIFQTSGQSPGDQPIRRHSNYVFVDQEYNSGHLTLDQTQSYYGIDSLTKKWAAKSGASAKDGISVLLEAICSDFARSAALAADNVLIGDDVFNIFKNLPRWFDAQHELINRGAIQRDDSFTGAIFRRSSDDNTFISVFDRDLNENLTNFANQPLIVKNIVNEIIPFLVNTDSRERDIGIASAERITEDITSKLRSSADAVELAMGLNKPMLDPVNVLDEILVAFRAVIRDSNPVKSNSGIRPNQMLPIASLTEASYLEIPTASGNTTFDSNKMTTWQADQYDLDTITVWFANFHTLVTALVASMGSRGRSNKFFKEIPGLPDNSNDQIIDAMNRTLNSAAVTMDDGDLGNATDDDINSIKESVETLPELVQKIRQYNNEAGARAQVDSDEFSDDLNTVGTRFVPTHGSGAGISPNLRGIDTNTPYRATTDALFKTSMKGEANGSAGIFMSIVNILNKIYDATGQSDKIFTDNSKMKSSGVDTDAIVSLMTSVFSLIAKEYCTTSFITFRSYDDGGYGGAESVLYQNEKPVGYNVNFSKFSRLYEDLQAYLENKNIDDIRAGASPLKDLLTTVKNDSIRHRKPATDFVIFCRALADEISSKSQALIASFKDSADDDQTDRVDRSFLESEKHFEKILDYSQINVSRNWISSLRQREGVNKYFDNFFASKAEENFFYTMTRDANLLMPKGDNLRMMAIGIPYGFTKSVLGIDPLLNPDGFVNNRKVKIEVSKYDVILGNVVETDPKVFIFDLNMFFKEVTDPTESSPNPEIIDGTSVDLSKSVTDREYPPPETAKSNIIFEKLDLINKSKTDINYDPNDNLDDKKMFSDHLDDYLAKTYIKIAYGIDLSERSFYIDAKDEKIVSSKDERKRMNDLIDAHLKKLTGQELTIDSYLAGNRRTREVHDRLKEGKRTKSVIEDIDSNIEGVSPESGQIAADDIITFTQMMGTNNPFIAPSSIRRKITKPKLFERVFCIMLDPDSFEIKNTQALSAQGRNNLINKYVDTTLPVYEYKDNKRVDGNPQVDQYLVKITTID